MGCRSNLNGGQGGGWGVLYRLSPMGGTSERTGWVRGAGEAVAASSADRAGFGDYTEIGQVIPVRFGAERGNYTHALYLDGFPPIVSGREIWSFPKKLGSPHDVGQGSGEGRYHSSPGGTRHRGCEPPQRARLHRPRRPSAPLFGVDHPSRPRYRPLPSQPGRSGWLGFPIRRMPRCC